MTTQYLLLSSYGLFATLSCVSSLSPSIPPPNISHVVAPKSVAPGETFVAYVHVEDILWKAKQSVSVHVTRSTGSSLASSKKRIVIAGSFNAFSLTIPKDADPAKGPYSIDVKMTTHMQTVVTRSLPLTISGKNRIILIQTDKPIYKPGEKVMGRVIVLDRETRSVTGGVTVTIENPKSYTIGRYSNIDLEFGVGKFEFPLSSEPVLGTHTLCATYEGLPKNQRSCFTFKVKRYVLPRFSCSLVPTNDVIDCVTRKICFTVSATYTYGQKVRGNLKARLTPNYRWLRCPLEEAVKSRKIDGTTEICIKFCTRGCGGKLNIDVNVTDPQSQTTVQCDGPTSITRTYRPNKLTFIQEDKTFSQCHYTTVKVAASSLTGIPKYANVNLTGTIYTMDKSGCQKKKYQSLTAIYQQTDRSGVATFNVCTPCNALSIRFTASAVPKTGETNRFANAYTSLNMIYAPERIVLSSNQKRVEVGNAVTVYASFSSKAVADYYIVSKGKIVGHDQCLPTRDENVRSKHQQLCEDGGIRRTCSFSFLVTSSMAPKVTVIVSQKNQAASRIAFHVIANTRSQMSLEFQEEEVRPGEKAHLLIQAPVSSYVGVVAVDQSVYLQQDKNQLTTAKLYDEIRQFDQHKSLAIKSYVCDWYAYWNCNCDCYGYSKGGNPPLPQKRPLPAVDRNGPPGVKGDEGRQQRRIIRPGKCCARRCNDVAYSPRYCSYVQASSYFTASGISVSDSDTTSLTECSKPPPPPKPEVTYDCCFRFPFWGSLARNRGPFTVAKELAVPLAASIPERRKKGPKGETSKALDSPNVENLVNPTRVRKYFPETWLWFEMEMNNHTQRKEVTVPDTITSWVADAFSVSPSTHMSIARPTTLRVFKPFFITLNLPYSVIRGELVEITLTVYNYLETPLTANVEVLVENNNLRIVHGKGNKTALHQAVRTVTVPASAGNSLSYYLLPLKNGHLPLKATARSTFAADSLIQNLFVEPEGVKEEYAQSALLCIEETPTPTTELDDASDDGLKCITKRFNASLPPDYVPDSESAEVSVTANYMGPTISGLESLLRLPTGCGEQNMLNFAPAVYIARYLDTIGKLDAATRKKALHYMQTGYQRELTYQRQDGSYSAFGDRDRCGSMWLTAFVLRSFGQADGLIGMSIDNRVQEEAIDFIISKQKDDGSFPPVCGPLHKEMQGCSGGGCSLTAYVTLALLEAGLPPKDKAVTAALGYLTNNCIPSNCSSPYNLALVAYTLTKASGFEANADAALDLLRNCAKTDDDHRYWQYTLSPTCENKWAWSYYCRSSSCDVETSAYALLAFANRGNIAYSLRIVRWLLEQRNPRGGFKSTQDTVVALQALSEYGQLTLSDGRVSATVQLTASGLDQELIIDSSNAMQVQTVQLSALPTVIEVSVCGSGCLLASLGVNYNVPKPDEIAAFDVSAVAKIQKGACKYLVRVCNRWIRNESDSSNMAVTDVTFFSSFAPVQSELKQLVKEGRCMIKRTDFKGRVLSVYFDEVTKRKCCFNVTMKRISVVEDLQGVPVITYNYYEPDQRGGTMLYPRQDCE
ncbi:alpha-2-macroglobulin-like protein 1 isoform X2 [Corticium candelabrum]|uniref:alpha-2-macroglobulin-like protein 1 isoform X2 n=1 Tax=Corticium candelabrum TaxID=121492 RepID=UPI002E2765C1|nr:alpha-2-macroglobulin-like protein 1 isoform X2 [Corticium candelabrum]